MHEILLTYGATNRQMGAEEDAARYRDYHYRFCYGVIAKLVTPGDKEPQGFILQRSLAGWRLCGDLPRAALGWYGLDQNAGFIGAIVSAAHTVGLGFIDRLDEPDGNVPIVGQVFSTPAAGHAPTGACLPPMSEEGSGTG